MPERAVAMPRFTYGDYREWTGEERWELLDGQAFAMSPAPSRRHQQIVGRLFSRIEVFLHDRDCEVYAAPFDVRLPAGEEADEAVETVVQPDVSVICDPGKLDDAGCRGAPDWIVEVLSTHTAARDQVYKRDLYERHGVREYWIVHPDAESVTVFRAVDEGTRGFSAPRTFGADESWHSVVLPELRLDGSSIFAP